MEELPQPTIMGMENFQEETRETAFVELIKNLFDETKILFITRLDSNMAFYTMKHIIIRHMYNDYYMNLETNILLVENPGKRPFYKKIVTNKVPVNFQDKLKSSYWTMYVDILKTMISLDGLGRHEGINVLKATDQQINVDERKEIALNQSKLM